MKYKIDCLERNTALTRVFGRYPEAFTQRPEVQTYITEFSTMTTRLGEILPELLKPRSLNFVARQALHDTTAKGLKKYAGIGMMAATQLNNPTLHALLKSNRRNGSKTSHYKLFESALLVVNEMLKITETLTTFGVTAEELNTWKTQVVAYGVSLNEFRDNQKNRIAKRQQANELTRASTQLLRNRFDPLMTYLDVDWPELVREYRLHRPLPSRKSTKPTSPDSCTLTGTVTNGITGDAIDEALLTVVAQDAETETAEDGLYELTGLTEGQGILQCEAEGFVSQATPLLTFTPGSTQTFNFALQPVATTAP